MSTFRKALLLLAPCLIALQCGQSDNAVREAWVDRPVSEWPTIALTSDITFQEKSFERLANAFLVSAPPDTFAVTAKHLFLVLRQAGPKAIDLGDRFVHWWMYPRNAAEAAFDVGRPINTNSREKTGEFRTLKVRDWLIFRVTGAPRAVTPLKIRTRPVEEGEKVTAVGYARDQESDSPTLVEMKVFRNPGPYFYAQTLTGNVDPVGRSGSPVIDANGHLVGIVSGAEGKLGVIGSVDYLVKVLANLRKDG